MATISPKSGMSNSPAVIARWNVKILQMSPIFKLKEKTGKTGVFTKRSAIVALVGLNLMLLATLLLASQSLPTAYAQAARGTGGFACVTAKVAGQTGGQ